MRKYEHCFCICFTFFVSLLPLFSVHLHVIICLFLSVSPCLCHSLSSYRGSCTAESTSHSGVEDAPGGKHLGVSPPRRQKRPRCSQISRKERRRVQKHCRNSIKHRYWRAVTLRPADYSTLSTFTVSCKLHSYESKLNFLILMKCSLETFCS